MHLDRSPDRKLRRRRSRDHETGRRPRPDPSGVVVVGIASAGLLSRLHGRSVIWITLSATT